MIRGYDLSQLDAQDVLDLAMMIENEARSTYEQLACWMSESGSSEAAALFRVLALQEAHHCEKIESMRRSLFGDAPVRLRPKLEGTSERQGLDGMDPDISLRGVLEHALEAERRAHDYYAEAAEHVSCSKAAALLEALRRAEVEHQRMIRIRLEALIGTRV